MGTFSTSQSGRAQKTHSWQSFPRRFWKLIPSRLRTTWQVLSFPTRPIPTHSIFELINLLDCPLWFQLTYLCLCSIKWYKKNLFLSAFVCLFILWLCICIKATASTLAINCEIKAHDLGFSFDLRFYLAHILCDSRCASGNPSSYASTKVSLQSIPNTHTFFSNFFLSFFCRTIPHLCRRLELRNWNSAIARSVHTIRRNLVSIKMQIFHLPVNLELPLHRHPRPRILPFPIQQLLFLLSSLQFRSPFRYFLCDNFSVTHSLIIGKRVGVWACGLVGGGHKKFITERQQKNEFMQMPLWPNSFRCL